MLRRPLVSDGAEEIQRRCYDPAHMRASQRYLLLAGLAGALVTVGLLTRSRSPSAQAGPSAPPSPPTSVRLGVLHGAVDGSETTFSVADVTPGKSTASLTKLGAVVHPPGSARRGIVARDGLTAYVVLAEDGDRHSSYANALHRIDAKGVAKLCSGVAKAQAPIVTKSGMVIVARGQDGPEPTDTESQQLLLRDDVLTIDAVDPGTGTLHTLFRTHGYQAFLATLTEAGREEVVVYLSTRTGASVIAIDPVAGTSRDLSPAIAPFARDFSWDAVHQRLVFVDLTAPKAQTWQVVALDPSTSSMRALFTTTNDHAMPFALPTGEVALSSEGDHGLATIAPSSGKYALIAPFGDGSDAVTHVSGDGRWIAVRHTPKVQAGDEPPRTFAYDPVSGIQVAIVPAASTHDEVTAIGFLAGAGGAP